MMERSPKIKTAQSIAKSLGVGRRTRHGGFTFSPHAVREVLKKADAGGFALDDHARAFVPMAKTTPAGYRWQNEKLIPRGAR